MDFSEDGYAAMLIAMALSPDRDEYAKPYTAREFWALESAVRSSHYGRLGKLLEADISGLMIYLKMSEAEAIRLYTLMNRSVQLMYMLEGLERESIEALTCFDAAYPARIQKKLGKDAPVFFFRCGSPELLNAPAIAILGIQGVRTNAAVRGALETLVKRAVERGYVILTGGELGVSRAAADAAWRFGGQAVEVLGGGMKAHVQTPEYRGRIDEGRAAALSLQHPEAAFTLHQAAARNRLLATLADAVFVFNTDGRRAEGDILQRKLCDWVYAWEGYAENRPLIDRGAAPFGVMSEGDFDALCEHWSASDSQQLSIFDFGGL